LGSCCDGLRLGLLAITVKNQRRALSSSLVRAAAIRIPCLIYVNVMYYALAMTLA
jgi:hypothetical protein